MIFLCLYIDCTLLGHCSITENPLPACVIHVTNVRTRSSKTVA